MIKKQGPGRPAVPDKRTIRSIKVSDAEWAEIKRRADEAGVSIAEYIRRKTLEG